MNDTSIRLLEALGVEIKKKKTWSGLILSVLVWIFQESLKHRIFSALNDWQDKHKDDTVNSLKEIAVFVLDHPYMWLVLVVAGILVHAYYISGRVSPTADAETHPKNEATSNLVSQLDPRMTIHFLDERKDQLFKKTALRLTNVGGSEALDVNIDSIL